MAVVDDSLGWNSLDDRNERTAPRTPRPSARELLAPACEEGDGLLSLGDHVQGRVDAGYVDLRLAGWCWSAVGLKVSSIL